MDAPTGSNFKSNGASAAQMQARFKKQLELHQAKLSSLKVPVNFIQSDPVVV